MSAINPDDILSAIYRVLHSDATFTGLVNSIDKGPKRRNGYTNPSCTVHLLTAPIGEGTQTVRGSLVVNVYEDDYSTGQANSALLGSAAQRITELLHESQPAYNGLLFHWVRATEPLGPLPSDKDGEHLTSVRLMYAVNAV